MLAFHYLSVGGVQHTLQSPLREAKVSCHALYRSRVPSLKIALVVKNSRNPNVKQVLDSLKDR